MSMETHHVKRAIVVAAGIGKRMRPLTLEMPKPLVKVNGVRMIDTVVDALLANGIEEIHVVVGYLREQFDAWARERGGINLIENPYYDSCNNISSLYVAHEHLRDCIILDGDQMVYEPSVLSPAFTRSGYNAVWCKGETDEWLMEVKDGVVQSCSRTGGAHGWQLYSVSRWTAEDGERLQMLLEKEFESGNRQIYWDDVAMFCYPEQFELGIREMQRGDIVEIDSIEELAALDPTYRCYLKNADNTVRGGSENERT